VEQYGPPGVAVSSWHVPALAPPSFWSAVLSGCGRLTSPEVPLVPTFEWLAALAEPPPFAELVRPRSDLVDLVELEDFVEFTTSLLPPPLSAATSPPVVAVVVVVDVDSDLRSALTS
jgi:hypothetical protein